jgi:hypothetical protein
MATQRACPSCGEAMTFRRSCSKGEGSIYECRACHLTYITVEPPQAPTPLPPVHTSWTVLASGKAGLIGGEQLRIVRDRAGGLRVFYEHDAASQFDRQLHDIANMATAWSCGISML